VPEAQEQPAVQKLQAVQAEEQQQPPPPQKLQVLLPRSRLPRRPLTA
jgi:hypothetical protein